MKHLLVVFLFGFLFGFFSTSALSNDSTQKNQNLGKAPQRNPAAEKGTYVCLGSYEWASEMQKSMNEICDPEKSHSITSYLRDVRKPVSFHVCCVAK